MTFESAPSYSERDNQDLEKQLPVDAKCAFPGDLCPTIPTLSNRYDGQIKAPDFLPSLTIPGGFFTSVSANTPVTLDGGLWTRFVHPEGSPYWYHTVWRILVGADLMQPDIKAEVEHWSYRVGALIKDKGIELPSSSEIVLELDPASKTCKYYVACREERTIGWLTECKSDDFYLPVRSEAHLKLQLEHQFWKHAEYFPMHAPPPPRSEEELLSELAFSIGDLMTSRGSTSSSTPAENLTLYNLLNSQRKDASTRTWLVARIWLQIVLARSLNYYGEYHARLDRSTSLTGSESANPLWISLISRILFLAQPERYRQKICDIWVDRIVYQRDWKAFMEQTVMDWQGVATKTLYIAIINVIFMIVPAKQAFHQWANFASIVLAISGLCASHFNIQRYCDTPMEDVTEVADYLSCKESTRIGMYPLAIKFGLPQALFLWSIVAFFGSLLCFMIVTLV